MCLRDSVCTGIMTVGSFDEKYGHDSWPRNANEMQEINFTNC